MSYWYPTQQRVERLGAELKRLGAAIGQQVREPGDHLISISSTLTKAQNSLGFPSHQTSHWLWIASQFRLIGNEDEAGIAAGAALAFLSKSLSADAMAEETVQDLNWVVDETVRALSRRGRPQLLSSYLSQTELLSIETQLAKFASVVDFDATTTRATINGQLRELTKLSSDRRFRDVLSKVDALFDAAGRPNVEGRAARSALLYLAESDDVVPDDFGILGLLDDIYVVDWAYAVISHQTRCVPIIESLLVRWPFIADLAVIGSPPLQLDLYGQYVTCATLNRLFDVNGTSAIVVRETAGFPSIAAFMAAVQCAKLQAHDIEQQFMGWPVGQPVRIGDGDDQFRAVFKGSEEVNGRRKMWLGVRNDGRITIDMTMIPYVAKSPVSAKTLSDGASIAAWLKTRHIDPLVSLTGANRKRLEKQECVLLVGPRHKIDSYFQALHPFGSSAGALLGAKYINSDRQAFDICGVASDTPFIYACSDADVAFELISTLPDHVSGWRVIVDGARTGNLLRLALDRSSNTAVPPICIFAELHERESGKELEKDNIPLWYLEAHDAQAPSLSAHRSVNDDELTLAIRRQGGYYYQAIKNSDVRNEFLENVSNCLHASIDRANETSELSSLDIQVSSFLKKAISMPLNDPATTRELKDAARSIVSHASVLSQYHQHASSMLKLFQKYVDDPQKCDREEALVSRLIVPNNPGLRVAVICKSGRIANVCAGAASASTALRSVVWTTMDDLRRYAPVHRLVIPGWLDRMSMREISNNGYAEEVEFLLFPFEQRWLKATLEANRKWERRLEASTVGILKQLSEREPGGKGGLWTTQSLERVKIGLSPVSEVAEEPPADLSEIELLEAKEISIIQDRAVRDQVGQDVARAQLVLFEEDGAFAYLPPDGKVIALAETERRDDREKKIIRDAEAQLFRKVTSLRPGMVLAFSSGNDRDLVDARADQFLEGADSIRTNAGLWKAALRRHLRPAWTDYVAFARKMTEAGESRDPVTVRAWATRTNSVAPMNYRKVIPLIAKLTNDVELQRKLAVSLEAVDLMYRARALAAQAIIQEVFSGEINLHDRELIFHVGNAQVRYSLLRIRAVADIQQVAVERIGKIQFLHIPVARGYEAEQVGVLQ